MIKKNSILALSAFLLITTCLATESESISKAQHLNSKPITKEQALENKQLRHLVDSECPSVVVCGTSDTSKQVAIAIKQNQKANSCYIRVGDTEMSKISGEATTRCQTMMGSINPIVRDN